jgi:hypothetical protein
LKEWAVFQTGTLGDAGDAIFPNNKGETEKNTRGRKRNENGEGMTYQFTLSFPWRDKAAGLANRAPGGRSRAARGMAQTFWPFIREGLIGEAEVRAALADASQRNGLVKTNGAYSGSFKYVRADGGGPPCAQTH